MIRSYKKVKVNKEWAEKNLIKKDWQRTPYSARINKFVSYMKAGKFRTSLITVSKQRDGILVLLDGQHKIEAIKKEYAEYEMDVCIYDGLSEEEEIEIYQMLNDVKAFRLVDDIKVYMGRHDWLDAFFEKNFPIEVTLHGGINSMKIGDILNVLSNGLRDTIVRDNISRNKLPLFLENLDAGRYSIMKDFCTIYLKCFGPPHRDNWMYKNAVMFTLLRIWIKNKDKIEENELIKRFKNVESSSSVRQDTTAGGFDSGILEQMTRKIYRILNKGYSKNLMEYYWRD